MITVYFLHTRDCTSGDFYWYVCLLPSCHACSQVIDFYKEKVVDLQADKIQEDVAKQIRIALNGDKSSQK